MTCDCCSGDFLKRLREFRSERGPLASFDDAALQTRTDFHRQLLDHVRSDAELVRIFIEDTRLVYMSALLDAFGFAKMDMLFGITEVRLLRETDELIYLVLPDPSRENAVSEAPDGPVAKADSGDRRSEIEHQILCRARSDSAFRDRLLFQPNDTYREFARRNFSDFAPDFLKRAQEIRIVPETKTSLALVLPADFPTAALNAVSAVTSA